MANLAWRRVCCVVAALVMTVALVACGSSDDGGTSTAGTSADGGTEAPTIKIIWETYPSTINASTGVNLLAQRFDAAQGYRAELQPIATAGSSAMVNRGQAQIASTPLYSALGLYESGAKNLRLVGANVQHALTAWCTYPGSGIDSVADLKGKKVATIAQPFTDYLMGEMLAGEGLTMDDVERVNVKAPVEAITAVQNRVVDAGWCVEPLISIGAARGNLREIWRARDHTDSYSDAFFTNADFIEEHPEQVQQFIDSIAQADQFIERETIAAAANYAREARLPPAVAERALEAIKDQFSVEIDPERLQREIDLQVELGTLRESLDVNEILAPEFAEKALARFPLSGTASEER